MEPIDYQREIFNSLNNWAVMPWYRRWYWIARGLWDAVSADGGKNG